MLIRIWALSEADAPPPAPAWADGSPLILMLRQIVSLGGGTPSTAPSGPLRARFPDEFQAAKTARHLQALLTGFANASGQRTIAVSIAITPPGESHADTLDVYLEHRAQPAQILVASTSTRPSLLPTTLHARRLEPPAPGLELYELLWLHKEQAAAAAVQARTRAAKQAQTSAPLPSQPAAKGVEANRILSTYRSAFSFVAAASQDAAASLGQTLRSFRQHSLWTSGPALVRRALAQMAPAGRTLARGTLALGSSARVALTRKPVQRAVAGVCALAVVVGLSSFLLLRHRPSSAAPALPPKPTPAPATLSAPATILTPSTSPDAPTSTVPKSARTEPQKKAQPPEEQDRPNRSRGDLSPEQTRQVLSRGQNELDRGCYERAITYYRRILADDPRNGVALIGIEKANTRKRLSGDDPQGHCQ